MTRHLPGGSGDSSDPFDPVLDLRADEAEQQEIGHAWVRSRSWRGLFRWSATSAPVALLLLAGLAFGPRGLALLSPPVLSLLNPVVPIAVAALGLLVGLSLGDRWTDDRRVFGAACLGSTVTLIVVSAGLAAIALTLMAPLAPGSWLLIAGGGICAASSLTLPAANPLEPQPVASRIVGIGVLVPILAGGFVLARQREGTPDGAVLLMAQASVVTMALAAAAWLLLSRASSETEERVFAVSALLLVGGVAEALSLSALFGGLVAGLFWRYAGGAARASISRDVLFVQHPLVVLVLLVAGARADLSPASLGLGAAYLGLRLLGQLAGSSVTTRVVGADAPDHLMSHQLPPGVFGVAFALNAAGVAGADASVLLAVVVSGTIGAELVVPLLSARRVRA